ncbi:MAG: glycosyltransferase [Bacteriovoracaceae bacterium]
MIKVLQTLSTPIQYDNRAKRTKMALQTLGEVKTLTIEDTSNNEDVATGKIELFIKIFKALFKNKYNFVYAEGLPPLVLSLLPCLITGTPLVYDSRELYLKDEKGKSTYTYKHRMVEWFCMLFVKHIVSANDERVKYMQHYYGFNKHYTFVRNISELTPHLNLKNKNEIKKLVYQGELGRLRGIEKLLEALPFLKTNCETIFIVPLREQDRLKAMIKVAGAEKAKITILDFMSPQDLQLYLEKCDLGYLAYELHGPNNTFCEPNKLYEYGYAGLPMLTSPQPLFQEIFREMKIGHLIRKDIWDNGTAEQFASEVEIALSDTYPLADFKKFCERYNFNTEKERFLNYIRKNFVK